MINSAFRKWFAEKGAEQVPTFFLKELPWSHEKKVIRWETLPEVVSGYGENDRMIVTRSSDNSSIIYFDYDEDNLQTLQFSNQADSEWSVITTEKVGNEIRQEIWTPKGLAKTHTRKVESMAASMERAMRDMDPDQMMREIVVAQGVDAGLSEEEMSKLSTEDIQNKINIQHVGFDVQSLEDDFEKSIMKVLQVWELLDESTADAVTQQLNQGQVTLVDVLRSGPYIPKHDLAVLSEGKAMIDRGSINVRQLVVAWGDAREVAINFKESLAVRGWLQDETI